MPRTAVAVQAIVRTGIQVTFVTADSVNGNSVANTGYEFIWIVNGGGVSLTVTFVTPIEVDGLAVADRTVVIPSGEDRVIGPFPVGVYTSTLQINYSVAGGEIAALTNR
jgi:hypothetical protein